MTNEEVFKAAINSKELLSIPIPLPKEERTTFLEITRMPHYEVVISRLYEFYLQDIAEHGFKDLFLKSLIALINKKWKTQRGVDIDLFPSIPKEWTVCTELATPKGNRIDIYIEWTDDPSIIKTIVIENKIFHFLRNDLQDYLDTSSATEGNKVGILLTLGKDNPRHPQYVHITHDEWLAEVKNNLGLYITDASDRHIFFLKDFVLNLNKLTTNMSYLNDFANYYNTNRTQIELLIEAREKFVNQVFIAFEQAGSMEPFNWKPLSKRADRYRSLEIIPGMVKLTLVFLPKDPAPFVIVYEILGTAMNHIEQLNGALPELQKKYDELWTAYYKRSDFIHVAGISYNFSNLKDTQLTTFFEAEFLQKWQPICNEFKKLYNLT